MEEVEAVCSANNSVNNVVPATLITPLRCRHMTTMPTLASTFCFSTTLTALLERSDGATTPLVRVGYSTI